MTDLGVTLVQLVELALLKEEDRVEMILLDLPELLLEWSEGVPSGFGYMYCPFIVVWVILRTSLFVPDIEQKFEALLRFPLVVSRFDLLSLCSSQEEGVRSATRSVATLAARINLSSVALCERFGTRPFGL